MNPAKIVAILNMVLTAEPAVVQLVHDLLAHGGGQTDQAILTADIADWDGIIAEAKKQLAPPPAAG